MCFCRTDGDAVAPAVPAPEHSSLTRPLDPSKSDSWIRRIAKALPWALSLTMLTLIPKCPACIAAYVLIVTGVGLSLPTAAAIRFVLITLGIASLVYLVHALHARRPVRRSA